MKNILIKILAFTSILASEAWFLWPGEGWIFEWEPLIVFIGTIATYLTLECKITNEKISDKVPLNTKDNNELSIVGENALDEEAINLALHTPHEVIDDENRYTYLGFFAEITNGGDYKAKYICSGKRLKEEGYTFRLIVRMVASSAINDTTLQLRAYDYKTKEELSVAVFDNNQKRVKEFEIILKQPVKYDTEFKIFWEFFWPGCITLARDSDTINLKPYSLKPIDQVEHELVFPYDPHAVTLYELNNLKYQASDIKVKKKKDNDKYLIGYKANKVSTEGYVLAFSNPRKEKHTCSLNKR